MYSLTTSHSFDAAHFLSGYEGKCSNIHGHRWKVILEVCTEHLSEDAQTKGMYVDFADLKKDLKNRVNELEHCLIIETGSLRKKTLEALQEEGFRIVQFDFRPTAENMARYFYGQMKSCGYQVKQVTVYETPSNAAAYTEIG